jgi:SAM-dependent methyltransferase
VAHPQPDPTPLDAGRPFYHRFAWAYDLIMDHPAGPPVEAVAQVFAGYGVSLGSSIVDAGCGTGAYAMGLAERGFAVAVVDRSPELLALAADRAARHGAVLDVACADFTRGWAPPGQVDGVLCRGVLNDVVEDGDRAAAFAAFASWLRPGGVLLLDVRDRDRSIRRYADSPFFERAALRGHDVLTYTSTTSAEHGSDRLQLVERWIGTVGGEPVEVENRFEMRCWTPGELTRLTLEAGFSSMSLLDPQVIGAREDRIVAVAVR